MKNLIKSEILKLKNSWLLKLSFLVATLVPWLTLAMTLFSEQAQNAPESMFFLLIRQNHIFLTLLMCNLLFSLMVTNLFFKEFQYGTIVDIISVPVKRTSFIVAKEITMFLWIVAVGMFSYVICIIQGAVFGMEGFTLDTILFGLWRYVVAIVLSFIPVQLIVWVTLLFKNYVVSLAISVVALVGSIVAFNTKDIIFMYPYSIPFVLTNFKEAIMLNQIMTSAITLAVVALICFFGIFVSFNRMDI
jgi:bacitracin transport system permease protein